MHYNNNYKYSHVSQEERYEIRIWLREWLSRREIAKKLGRSHSTIVREINRNWKDVWFYRIKYNPEEAQLKYKQRLQKRNFNNRIFVKEKWKKKRIHDWLKKVDGKIWIDELLWRYRLETWKKLCATSTVYNWVRDVWWEMERLLKYKGFWYNKRWDKRKEWRYNDILTIDERPEIINKRMEIWHWECDTVVSWKDGKWWIVTMVDRMSRYEMMMKVKDLRGITVWKAMKEMIEWKIVKSLTIDNWWEFSKIRNFRKKWIKIYRCHAYSSWEKWTNERHNGMIRWWIPKGYDISIIDEESIAKIEMSLNHKPRKILWYRTPYEVYHSIDLKYIT